MNIRTSALIPNNKLFQPKWLRVCASVVENVLFFSFDFGFFELSFAIDHYTPKRCETSEHPTHKL